MLNIKEKYEKCWFCESYYGPCFDEPVCVTCHYFIFPNIIEQDVETPTNSTNSAASNNLATSRSNGSKITVTNLNNLNNESQILTSDFDNTELNAEIVNRSGRGLRSFDEKLESNDSGNEDSDNYLDQQQASNSANSMTNISTNNQNEAVLTSIENQNLNNNNNNNNTSFSSFSNISYPCPLLVKKKCLSTFDNKTNNNTSKLINDTSRIDPLVEQIMSLSLFNEKEYKSLQLDMIKSLPTEVLLSIFRNLDDLSLWSVSLVCRRWHELISQEISQAKWKSFISERWVLFRPSIKVKCYQKLYSQLVQSSNCFYCLRKIHNRTKSFCADELKKSWRHKRLLLELKALQQDPPDGINAKPLDSSCFYWQASITGPNGSPYEGGIFYLYLQIPQSYPLNPPMVRFITKIYHPNVSKHGDIGLDSIHDNWSLALTISKVLISIQSLLTDPYTHVCMDNEIGRLYKTNREVYERNAKLYTIKYAMTDFLMLDEQAGLLDYFSLIERNSKIDDNEEDCNHENVENI